MAPTRESGFIFIAQLISFMERGDWEHMSSSFMLLTRDSYVPCFPAEETASLFSLAFSLPRCHFLLFDFWGVAGCVQLGVTLGWRREFREQGDWCG